MGNKKNIGIVIGLLIVLIGGFVMMGEFNLEANAHDTYDIEQGKEEGHVIQKDNEILNLSVLETFYKNTRKGIDDHIVIVYPQDNQQGTWLELEYSNGKLKLFYDVTQDDQGRKEYKLRIYDSIKKIYKNNRVTYLLVNDQEERRFLSYDMQ